MNLFDMTESQLDSAIQAHYNNMYDAYYHTNEPDPCCKYCTHFCPGNTLDRKTYCERYDEDGAEYYTETDPDDWCEEYEQIEDEPEEDW